MHDSPMESVLNVPKDSIRMFLIRISNLENKNFAMRRPHFCHK